jgi:hypothetical protein
VQPSFLSSPAVCELELPHSRISFVELPLLWPSSHVVFEASYIVFQPLNVVSFIVYDSVNLVRIEF